MKHLKTIAAFTISILSMGSAIAYPSAGYPDRIVLAQHRVVVRDARVVPVQPPQTQRRFVMPPNGPVYQRGVNPQYVPPGAPPSAGRMSAEERRALRRQINEANKGIYYRPPN